jgi:hypothetical protein
MVLHSFDEFCDIKSKSAQIEPDFLLISDEEFKIETKRIKAYFPNLICKKIQLLCGLQQDAI